MRETDLPIDTDTAPPPAATITDQVAALVTRRRKVRGWWQGSGPWSDPADQRAPIGLALSGGGIRSATFSLGLVQGLAKSSRDALARIDILSTVSGGGYTGCFLRSLFVPNAQRAIQRRSRPIRRWIARSSIITISPAARSPAAPTSARSSGSPRARPRRRGCAIRSGGCASIAAT